MLSAASCFTTRCSQRLHFNKIKFYCFNQRHCSVKYGHVFENGKCLAVKDQGAFSWHHLALCWGSCFTQEAFAAPLGFRTATGRWSPVALIKLACPLRFQGLLGIHGPHLYAGNHKSRGPFIHSLEPSYQFYLAMSQFGFLFLLTNRAPPLVFYHLCVCVRGEREKERKRCYSVWVKGHTCQWQHQRTISSGVGLHLLPRVNKGVLSSAVYPGPMSMLGCSVSASHLIIGVLRLQTFTIASSWLYAGSGVQIPALTLARQMLYPLNHLPSPRTHRFQLSSIFFIDYLFWDGILQCCPAWSPTPGSDNPPASSQVAGIAGQPLATR